jgi:ferredoxin
MRGMKVTVDKLLCEANALCAEIVPEVFYVDDSDELTILTPDGEVTPELADRVRDAVRSCPKMALSLEESDLLRCSPRLIGSSSAARRRPGTYGSSSPGAKRRSLIAHQMPSSG